MKHKKELVLGNHGNRHLQNSWYLYGEKHFEFSILEICEREALLEREQFYIDLLKPIYNILKIANSHFGVVRLPETGRKISNSKMGHSVSQETREKISKSLMGNIISQETKEKLSKSLKGHPCKPISDETRLKKSIAAMGNKNCLGRKQSMETKAKISLAKMGNKSRLGLKDSPEMRAKISESWKHRVDYFETKEKMSKSMKAYWNKRKAMEE